jgi:RNA polymerase sigma factor for flagellar operon FliA
MTEPTPVPDEPGEGFRTQAPVNGAPVNGAHTKVALRVDEHGEHTAQNGTQSNGTPGRNTATNGATSNGTSGNGTSGREAAGGTTGTRTSEAAAANSAAGRGVAGGASAGSGNAANGASVNGVLGRNAATSGAGDDVSGLGAANGVHGGGLVNGAIVNGAANGAANGPVNGSVNGSANGAASGVLAGGLVNGVRANGHAVTFGFGETAGVLPGDQRTFDDVEAGIVALWRQFGERPEQRLRDRLVLHYAPLVKYVAGRVGTGLPAHVEVADLIQSGIFGLVDAIEKFEPARGLKFETYAMQRIRGAILDDLRAQDWVPRSVRGRAREVERALERLGAQLRRTPTDAELADEMGLSLHELREIYAQLQLTSVVALDELAAAGRGSTPLADILEDQEALDPVALLVDQDNRRQLAQAIAHLAERDRVVVTLYYFENLTLAEIGRVLGVTESRVCQLHTRAVLRLRAKLLEKTEV